jgi:hypothetical protein
MNRRGFLTRSGLALGALIVGDEILETLDRLTHVRKSFPSAAVNALPTDWRFVRVVGDIDVSSSCLVTLQGSCFANGPWTPIETQPMVDGTITFSRPYWMSATIIIPPVRAV